MSKPIERIKGLAEKILKQEGNKPKFNIGDIVTGDDEHFREYNPIGEIVGVRKDFIYEIDFEDSELNHEFSERELKEPHSVTGDNPTPRPDESKEEFISRFMSDEEAINDFPDEEQRLAVANDYWERYQEEEEMENNNDTSTSNDNSNSNINKSVPTLSNYPIASRGRDWNAEDAVGQNGRVRNYIDGDPNDWGREEWAQFRDAHLWYDSDNPQQFGSYKLAYVDIVGGEPHIIPRAVFTIGAVLEGAMGGVDIPSDDKSRVRARVKRLYTRMRNEFDDDSIIVPWENEEENIEEHLENMSPTSRQVHVPSPNWEAIEKDLNIEVPAYGNKEAKIAFVGASPSDKDKIRKEPLTGISGKIFKEKYLKPLSLKKDDVFIINLVPEVKKNKYGILRQPNEDEISKYSEWVIKKLEQVDPDIIVALGNKAYRNLIKDIDYKLPHPTALYKIGDWGEVDRKIEHIEKSLEDIKKKIINKQKLNCKIVKSNHEKKLIYGIVLEPDTVDAHGDIISKEEIEKSCHFYMLNSQTIGLQHEEVAPARVVESYIAPVEFQLGKGQVKKGSWVLAVKVLDDDKWKKVKQGKFTGFSIGAIGNRQSRKIKVS